VKEKRAALLAAHMRRARLVDRHGLELSAAFLGLVGTYIAPDQLKSFMSGMLWSIESRQSSQQTRSGTLLEKSFQLDKQFQ
jgi:hypothetical protein